MNKIELKIESVSQALVHSTSYAVILRELDGSRKLPVVIGPFEAQAIAMAIENMPSSRPLSHDLMKNLMDAFSINLNEVLISDLKEGIFYATLHLESEGIDITLDSRTSDAIALAVRFNCPIYTSQEIMNSAGILMDLESQSEELEESAKSESKEEEEKTNVISIEQLNEILKEALLNEDYEKAAKIRDEIKKRSKN